MGNVILDQAAARYAARETGEAYFAWQKSAGRKAAVYNRRFFAPFVQPDDRLIDFGCGGGYLLQALTARSKTGVDINPAAREEAGRLEIEAAATLAELEGREFDVAISSHSLEHVTNPYETLVSLRRLLRAGGKLVLLLPVDDWGNERLQGPWRGPDINGHLYTWTPRLLSNLLAASGFRPVFIRVLNHTWPPILDRFLWNVSPALFDAAAYFFSVLLRRRQIWALAQAA